MGRLDGTVAVVTGASSGIGAATARRLGAEGALVTLCGRSEERLAQVRDSLRGAATVVAGDLTDQGAADAVVSRVLETHGRLDLLVNNAAVDHTDELLYAGMDDIRRTFEVNFFAAALLLQRAAAAMPAGGAIVNVSSRLASVGVPTMGFYGASKGALEALTRAAAVELAHLGVRVNAVAPGMTRTNLFDAWLGGRSEPAVTEEEVKAKIPLGDLASPDDVAAAIAFLGSADAAHITGVVLPVDGGYTAA